MRELERRRRRRGRHGTHAGSQTRSGSRGDRRRSRSWCADRLPAAGCQARARSL